MSDLTKAGDYQCGRVRYVVDLAASKSVAGRWQAAGLEVPE